MCGIFGFLGSKCCFKYGISGLRHLQNRGYDSAGCCGIDNICLNFVIKKYASSSNYDSINRLDEHREDFKNCNIGIFHTRWATHGANTDNNAHPHMDNYKRFAIVHNGIIENFYELKLELENNYNIHFDSNTDTEVVVNLISVYYDGKYIEKSIMKAISRLRGTWALVILCIDQPNNMYCIRRGSPLLIGHGDTGVIVTSEQAGFGTYVEKYICLKNDDLTKIVMKDKNISIEHEQNEKYEIRNITIKLNELSPEPYNHWTFKEIYEQYESSTRVMENRILGSNIILDELTRYENYLKNIDHVILLGCGTSLNASKHSVYFFKDLCKLTTVQAFDGAEFIFDDIPKHGTSCAIFLSQSGETKDLYRCIKICHDNYVLTIGVINVIDSLISRDVESVCYLNAGREVSVASTKAFTSQIMLVCMIAIFIAQIKNINKHKRDNYIESLSMLPSQINEVLSTVTNTCQTVAEYLIHHKDLFILGKGNMISVAEEGALKTKEIGYIHSEAYGSNSLRHGPYALIEKGTPIIFLNSDDSNTELVNSTIEEVISRNAYPIVISDANYVSRHAIHKIIVPKNKNFNGILHNIPMQIMAYYMACLKGHNPDMPRNLSKSVTV